MTHYLTGHDERTGKAIIKSTREGNWTRAPGGNDSFNVPYTTSEFPVSLNNDKDIITYDEVIASQKLGLDIPNGTVCRMVDLAPRSNQPQPYMLHRTQSLDYGVVLEGSVELLLDSGEKVLMHRGDVAVQRGTLHGFRNPSKIGWARMFFVLQYSQKVIAAGKTLEEVPNVIFDPEGLHARD